MVNKMINTACPSCRTDFQVSEELVGKDKTCTKCNTSFTVERLPDQKAPPPLGRIALQHGIISREQLNRAIEVQDRGKEMGKALALDDILLKLGFISLEMLNKLFAATVRALGKEFADIAFSKGFVARETLDKALSTQAEEFKKSRLIQVGDLLLESGEITRQQYDLIMFGYQDRAGFQDIYWKRTRKEPSPPLPKPKATVIGELAVKSGLISRAQLDEAMTAMEEEGSPGGGSLEEMLRSKNMISQEMLNRLVVAAQRKLDMIFCEIALKKGFVNKEQIEEAKEKQDKSCKNNKPRLIGDILVEEGVLSLSCCNDILKFQGRGELLLHAVEIPGTPTFEPSPERRRKGEGPELPPKDKSPEEQPQTGCQELPLKQDTIRGISGKGTGPAPTSNKGMAEPPAGKTKETTPEAGWKEKRLDRETLMGRLAVEHNFLSRDKLDEIIEELRRIREGGSSVTLEQILKEKELIPRRWMSILHLERIFLENREKHKLFTRIAVEKEFIRQADADAVLSKQMDAFKAGKITLNVPEILLSDKKISREQTATAFALMENWEESREEAARTVTEPSFPEIAVLADRLAAFLVLPPKLHDNYSAKEVKALLKEQGIVYGIADEEEIEAQLKDSAGRGGRFEIASGTPPRKGRDAEIKYHFNRDYLLAGTVSEDGLIDFQDRGEIPLVDEGDLLAEKTPMVPGKNGKDVYGNIITVPETRDLKISAGKGARLSEDRLRLYARVHGTPDASVGDKISVFSEYNVKGDVGLKTGHVRFDGNITVTGAVQPGFEVKGNHITAHEVIGARVDAEGDVNVSSGIIDARIRAGGNVRAKFVSNSIIEAFGNLEVQREILDSTALLSGACINVKGEIISSRISARKGFEVVQVGTDLSAPCVLRPGAEDHTFKVLDELHIASIEKEEALKEISSRLGEMETQQVAFHKNIADLTLAMERLEQRSSELKGIIGELREKGNWQRLAETVVEFKRTTDSIARANSGLKVLFKRQDILEEKISKATGLFRGLKEEAGKLETHRAELVAWSAHQEIVPQIKAGGTLMEQTFIQAPNSKLRLENNFRKVMIKEIRLDSGEYKLQIHEL